MILDEFEDQGFRCDGSFNAPSYDKLIVMLHGTFLTQHNTRITFHTRFYVSLLLRDSRYIEKILSKCTRKMATRQRVAKLAISSRKKNCYVKKLFCEHSNNVCQQVVYLSTTWAQIQTTARAHITCIQKNLIG